ncbi:NAD-dependent epimerase/dehydratase family protein [Modestobacter sp. I12A-02628]|uniref:NAD-dependent epimerase/dehydratase family protein n=2 Tax=Goekera deserti TaxID=2497753 RepID=A0A7K3WHC6_9ACTN|nr:NAD-dependent epimerase/dehydratase family protein [Goekera deserti]NDI47371.1 NAD-dependent epimerase/dehydratase family protein [Goekera deserti]NEL55901.1 NAD-dependent epimerase/dehydratase family protein [Goekera deserti]
MMGRATVLELLARGHRVRVLQRRPAGLPVEEVLGDVADADVVARAVRGTDAVLHLAAKVDVVGPWAEYERANVVGTRRVVEACRAAGVGRLVHVSSPAVAHAGSALMGVGAEPADPVGTRGHYARSKALAEIEALAADCPDLAVLAVRPHLVWGPGDTQLVERLVTRARAGRLPLIGAGSALIDTTYVDNAATALAAAVEVCGPVHGEAFVVSNGEPRPVAEVLTRVCAAAGVPGPRGRVPFRLAWLAGLAVEGVWSATGATATPPLTRFLAEQLSTAHWFDQRRTRQALGWAPTVTLDEGFTRLAGWYAAA